MRTLWQRSGAARTIHVDGDRARASNALTVEDPSQPETTARDERCRVERSEILTATAKEAVADATITQEEIAKNRCSVRSSVRCAIGYRRSKRPGLK